MINQINFITNVLFGLSVLAVSSPTLGELFATMAPIYPRDDEQLVDGLGIAYRKISFPTADGMRLHGWFFPSNDADRPAIVYAPATARDQRSGISVVAPFHQAGFNVLLFSYRGHGHSEGNRFGFTYGAHESEDIDAAAEYLSESMGIKKIGVIGHSAGAASGIISTARNPLINAVVAVAPFPSVEEIWNTNRPTFFPKQLFELTFRFAELRKKFSRNQVRPKDVIDQISPRPVLLIHGREDRRITQKQAMDLYSTANEPKSLWLVEGASHGRVRSPFLEREIDEIIYFFDHAFRGKTPQELGIQYKRL